MPYREAMSTKIAGLAGAILAASAAGCDQPEGWRLYLYNNYEQDRIVRVVQPPGVVSFSLPPQGKGPALVQVDGFAGVIELVEPGTCRLLATAAGVPTTGDVLVVVGGETSIDAEQDDFLEPLPPALPMTDECGRQISP